MKLTALTKYLFAAGMGAWLNIWFAPFNINGLPGSFFFAYAIIIISVLSAARDSWKQAT